MIDLQAKFAATGVILSGLLFVLLIFITDGDPLLYLAYALFSAAGVAFVAALWSSLYDWFRNDFGKKK